MRTDFRRMTAAAAALLAAATGAAYAATDKPTVVTLTQVPCQFIESENGADRGFKTTMKADCEAVNAKTGEKRLEEAKVLTLKPGDYVFKVTNKNVPYSLGFWLREKDYNPYNPLHKLNKISVSGGGLTTGKTLDYKVTLKPGEYVYSCPLNPTPNYRIVVK